MQKTRYVLLDIRLDNIILINKNCIFSSAKTTIEIMKLVIILLMKTTIKTKID